MLVTLISILLLFAEMPPTMLLTEFGGLNLYLTITVLNPSEIIELEKEMEMMKQSTFT